MARPLKVLLVEDSADDAEMILHELRRAGFAPEGWTRVETEPDFLRQLEQSWSLVISDYSMPQFNGLRAVQLLRERQPDLPFILISGTVGEDAAVAAMKHGATDYLLKDRITRLGNAVERALEQKRLSDERKQAEQIRAELAHRNESFIRALGEVVFDCNLTNRQIRWSGETAKCIGWSREELGAEIEGWLNRIHPDDLPGVRSQLETLSIEPLFVAEYRFHHQQGHHIWIFHRGVISRDTAGRITRVIGIMWDITERKNAEAALRENEERFRQLAENIQEVFWMTNLASHQMIYISPGYERIWGRSSAELYQSPKLWLEAIHPEDRDRIARAIQTKQAAGTYDEEYRIQRPDGGIRWVRDRAFPVRNVAGEIYRIVGIAEDMTRQRQLEEQFRQVQKMEAIGQLAGGVAHDFNNLLTVIRGSSDLLLASDSVSSSEGQELVQHIIAASDRATNLTRQLLVFSRKQVMQPRTVNLNELVENLIRMLRRIISAEVQLSCELGDDLPAIQADVGMLEQAVMNLVVNARDAMPHGGSIIIRTSVDRQHGLFRDPTFAPDCDCSVRLSVADTGTGIPPEILPHIFEPFFTTKEAGKGTGLGLATVYGIAQQHRGWVDVESKAGSGTTFHIGLPATNESLGRTNTTTSGLSEPKPARGTETILLVEDEAAVRRLVRSVLERSGYLVIEADSGKSALAVWREHQDKIDLVLTDMVMPDGLTGLMLAEKLRQQRPDLKIIFSSGYSRESLTENLTVVPNSCYLQKPLDPQLLLQTVRNFLDDIPIKSPPHD